ncbi:uncharacterized protein METZ01_LOCUS335131 [marine metagenome]|uniref:Uncharacterized protein n=1 Tax=marine metagenome TaxID=408172 RepID=A0A382QB55_9ZZZZ
MIVFNSLQKTHRLISLFSFQRTLGYTFFFKKAGNYMSYISRCQDENHFNF